MRVLVDTHAFIWWIEGNPRLSEAATVQLRSNPLVFVSVASAWEIAIKTRLGKLTLPGPIETAMDHYGFHRLALDFRHVREYQQLPMHHRDPFDRMLVAQAKVEKLVTITADRRFEPYGVPVIWAE